jgi:hypothetical protein
MSPQDLCLQVKRHTWHTNEEPDEASKSFARSGELSIST